mmetsp:Transcript_72079/g.168858  ORF Transcript_72079/g.168858 Transcript_72079/m.168858 type:complete len:316 (-) Transcript_72079:99-1046(-)
MAQLRTSAHVLASNVCECLEGNPGCHEVAQATRACAQAFVVAEGGRLHRASGEILKPLVVHRPWRGADQKGAVLVPDKFAAEDRKVGDKGVQHVRTRSWSIVDVVASRDGCIQACFHALQLIADQAVYDEERKLPVIDNDRLPLAVDRPPGSSFPEINPRDLLTPSRERIPLQGGTHEVGEVLHRHGCSFEHRWRLHPLVPYLVPHALGHSTQMRDSIVDAPGDVPGTSRIVLVDEITSLLAQPNALGVWAHQPELGGRGGLHGCFRQPRRRFGQSRGLSSIRKQESCRSHHHYAQQAQGGIRSQARKFGHFGCT